MVVKPLNKHQAKNQETHARLLKAAEEIFVRDGYDGAQLTTIASAAGRTKGAVYDHFKSKEDLFLALFEARTKAYIDDLVSRLQKCDPGKQSVDAFRDFYVGLVRDKTWSILTLEFKLFALRQPKSKDRLRKAFLMMKSSGDQDLIQKLFGRLNRQQLPAIQVSLSALGPILSGLILDSYFEPEILSEKAIQRILETVFNALTVGTKASQVCGDRHRA
jgi:AcrR family transcriptional regulator